MKHPFLDSSLTPNWEAMTSEHVKPDIEFALKNSKQALDAIANLDPSSITYSNSLKAFDNAVGELNYAWTKVQHLDAVNNSPELRKALNEMLSVFSEFFTKIYLNERLWNTIQTFAQSKEAKKLSPIQTRHLEEVIQDFKEYGADLSSDKKKELERINADLAKYTQKYSENVLDATNAWELIIEDEKQLAGLPEFAKTTAFENALRKNIGSTAHPKWRFTLHEPSVTPVLQYLEDDSIRQKVWKASVEVGQNYPYDNTEFIQKILNLRQEKSKLLGFKNFADLILRRRMAKTGAKAKKFVEDLHDRILDQFNKEVNSLEEYKANKIKKSSDHLEPWEGNYWAVKRRKELFNYDEEQIRPYFPIDSVINGLFKICEQLFNISIKENKKVKGWHEEVKYYEVFDKSGHHLGSFYSDWFPRESKRGGAWMGDLLTAEQGKPHLGVICGNLTRPTKDKPALLSHREVETIFHEFGHLLHHLFGDVEVKSLHGTQVAWDFVELPSQILENWTWERQSLDLFARHYKTNDPIPKDLFDKMNTTRNYLSAIGTMRQLSVAKMDLELHINYYTKQSNLDKFVDGILETYLPKFKTKPPTSLRRQLHLFSSPTGYASGYYSYHWAEVLDADAFTRFKKEGILNLDTGIDFRQKILSKGNSRPADELFRSFMGRDPELEPMLKRKGLLSSEATGKKVS